ncbi:hypothetical protein F-liban_46 [Faustovirus]|nr:hypothetical protein F-liban_46 [Faustovirus]
MDIVATIQLPTEIVDIICRYNSVRFKYTCKRYHRVYKLELIASIRVAFVIREYMKPHPIYYSSFNWSTRVVCYELDPEVSWREFRRGNGEFKRALVAPHPFNKHKINSLYYHAHKFTLEQYREYLSKLHLHWQITRVNINAMLGAIARIDCSKI